MSQSGLTQEPDFEVLVELLSFAGVGGSLSSMEDLMERNRNWVLRRRGIRLWRGNDGEMSEG